MKLLAFVDTHGSVKALKKITEKAKKFKPNLLICAGDISIFEQGLDYLLHKLNKIGIPMLIVPGNHESNEELNKSASLFDNITNIHGKHFEADDCIFFGYGGGGFSLTDSRFKVLSKKFEKKIRKSDNKKIILVTHAPPYKTKIDRIVEESCGSKTIRRFIEKTKPELVISGHLHENAGKEDKIGRTRIINPGPFGKIVVV